MNKVRYLKSQILQDLLEKMVFIGGPRQVGKTTLARQIIRKKSSYLNWDNVVDRHSIMRNELPLHLNELIFNEIHKFSKWRTFMKGLYDTSEPGIKIIVTGSARLDHFKKGGDSLFGRYHYFRLHPFSLREINKHPGPDDVKAIFTLGDSQNLFSKEVKKPIDVGPWSDSIGSCTPILMTWKISKKFPISNSSSMHLVIEWHHLSLLKT